MTRLIALLFWSLGFNAAFAASFETTLMPGQVIQAHAKIETECSNCHQKFDKSAQDKLCMACHKNIAADLNNKQGFHGKSPAITPCKTCHTDHKGREKNIVVLDPQSFDHAITDFTLDGKHTKLECKKCHGPNTPWRDAPQRCNDCHRNDDTHKGSLGTQCQNCHTSERWDKAAFDHSKTKLALTGAHEKIPCQQCHVNKQWKLSQTSCVSCHKKDDVHKTGFGAACESCHSTVRFTPALSFNHETNTLFKLMGAHKTTACKACHAVGIAAHGLGQSCVSCHKKDDPHLGKLGAKCESCHNETRWKQSFFDHNKTRFILKHKHSTIACSACHKTQQFVNTPTSCNACHQKEDKHKGNFGTQCEQCHSDKKWSDIFFDHQKNAHWPLTGAHAKTGCIACHKQSLSVKLSTQCQSCHQKDDVHKGKLGTQCASCHNDSGFKNGITFNHSLSRFVLKGAHTQTACRACHRDQLFVGTPSQCFACHQKNDVHKGSFGQDCAQCHNERHFMLWQFDHQRTGFPLVGAHNKLTCNECHTPGSKNKSSSCGSCHSKDDPHDGQFGVHCSSCHSIDKWRPALIRKPQ